MKATLAQPRGFCAGVVRAVEIVERALDRYGAPVYVLHEIVHNGHVVDSLRERGAVFVENLREVPQGAVTIFSAHGVSRAVVNEASTRGLQVIDATCPLVMKVHKQAKRFDDDDRELVIIGHTGHPEVEGTRGSVDGPVHVLCSVEEVDALDVSDPDRLAYVTQTTLSMDDTQAVVEALKQRFPNIKGPGLKDICYATQNRQNAARDLAARCDVVLVVGAQNSSNSNRLREVAEQQGARAYLVQRGSDLNPDWFDSDSHVGVTAGASAPEVLVQQVLDRLNEFGLTHTQEAEGVHEGTIFSLPQAVL